MATTREKWLNLHYLHFYWFDWYAFLPVESMDNILCLWFEKLKSTTAFNFLLVRNYFKLITSCSNVSIISHATNILVSIKRFYKTKKRKAKKRERRKKTGQIEIHLRKYICQNVIHLYILIFTVFCILNVNWILCELINDID